MATTDMGKATTAGASVTFDVGAALKDAGFAALVTLGLCFPIVFLRADEDMRNQLVLNVRWVTPLAAAALVFAARFGAIALRSIWLVEKRLAAAAPARMAPARPYGRLLGLALRIVGLAFLLVFPLGVLTQLGPGASLKWINNYGVQILIYVMLGWGLNIVVGLAGLLDLGYVAFYAVGAYSYALLSTQFGWSFWACLPLAGLLSALWGVLLGFPVLRLRGDYLAIVTLAFGEIIRIILVNWTDLTNGYAGIQAPPATFFGIPFTNAPHGFATLLGVPYVAQRGTGAFVLFGIEFTNFQQFMLISRTIFLFYLILALALLTSFVTTRLRRMPMGRAWEALREDEIACRSLGINTVTTKLTAFALGAMFAGFAGAFFAVRQTFITPESFTFIESATILAIVVLGGMGSQIGVVIAATIMIGGPELLREFEWTKRIFGADFDPSQYRMLIFGFAMVVMMILRPRGLVSTRAPSVFLKEKKIVSGALVGEGRG